MCIRDRGVSRREAIMAAGHGRADYLLYLDRRVVGGNSAEPVSYTPLAVPSSDLVENLAVDV